MMADESSPGSGVAPEPEQPLGLDAPAADETGAPEDDLAITAAAPRCWPNRLAITSERSAGGSGRAKAARCRSSSA